MTRAFAKTVSRKKAVAVLEAVQGMFPTGMHFALNTASHEGMARGWLGMYPEPAETGRPDAILR